MDNREIAEWAGFKYHRYEVTELRYQLYVHEHIDTLVEDPYWENPKGQKCRTYPNFPDDLNACVEWIWPKLLKMKGYDFQLRSPYKGIPYCFIIGKHDEHEAWTLYSGESDNPATAICLACEKLLIDGVE